MALAVETSEVVRPRIFIAGAGNNRRKDRQVFRGFRLSPLDVLANVHSDVTEGIYRSLGGVVVDKLLVPPNFGIGTPMMSYKLMEGVITRSIEKLGGQPVHLDGHSLGGYIAVEYAHNHPEYDIDVVAWSSPFGKVNLLPIASHLFGQRARRIKTIREEMMEESPKVTLIGSTGDKLIPPSSSLPAFPGADRLLFTSKAEQAISMGAYPITVTAPPGHIGILNHAEAHRLHHDISYRTEVLSLVSLNNYLDQLTVESNA